MQATRKDRHKKVQLVCIHCHTIFQRDQRNHNPSKLTCKICLMKRRTAIQSFTTKLLKEIIANNGVTNNGTDYENRLPDIKEEYYRREEASLNKLINEQSQLSE